jgi:hypothetical protein
MTSKIEDPASIGGVAEACRCREQLRRLGGVTANHLAALFASPPVLG